MNDKNDEITFKDLVNRGKRAVYKTNTDKRKGKKTDVEAKGYVLGRLDNITRYIREHDDEFTQFPKNYQLYNIAHHSGLKWDEDLKDLDLRGLEEKAGLPRMAAGHGVCCRCGRTLTDPTSVKNGIGPICIKKAR